MDEAEIERSSGEINEAIRVPASACRPGAGIAPMTFVRDPAAARRRLRPVAIGAATPAMPKARCSSTFGDTKVLCDRFGRRACRRSQARQGEGWVTAEYGMLPRSTHTRSDRARPRGQTERTHAGDPAPDRPLAAPVDLPALGERTITLDCDVIQADGGTPPPSPAPSWPRTTRWMAARARPHRKIASIFVAAVSVGIVEGTPSWTWTTPRTRRDTDMNVVMTNRRRQSRCRARPRARAIPRADGPLPTARRAEPARHRRARRLRRRAECPAKA